MTETVPAVSAGYRELLASTWRARAKANEDMLFDELIRDRNLLPTDPDRGTACRKIARKLSERVMRPAIT